jgi:hypothetical protein
MLRWCCAVVRISPKSAAASASPEIMTLLGCRLGGARRISLWQPASAGPAIRKSPQSASHGAEVRLPARAGDADRIQGEAKLARPWRDYRNCIRKIRLNGSSVTSPTRLGRWRNSSKAFARPDCNRLTPSFVNVALEQLDRRESDARTHGVYEAGNEQSHTWLVAHDRLRAPDERVARPRGLLQHHRGERPDIRLQHHEQADQARQ